MTDKPIDERISVSKRGVDSIITDAVFLHGIIQELNEKLRKTEWISVSEKKPPNGWMLIAYKYYADKSILCSDFGLHIDGIFRSGGLTRDVTHWMPLPEPPKDKK